MTIEITMADISYHLEKGDLKEWSEMLRALDKARQLAVESGDDNEARMEGEMI